MTGKRKGLTDLFPKKTAINELGKPLSWRFLSKGYHAYIGPMDRIPAVIVTSTPRTPTPLSSNLVICRGLKKRFKSTIKTKTRQIGKRILREILPLHSKA